MLKLKRRPGERVYLGDDIWVVFLGMQGNQAMLGFDAPKEVHILREELMKKDGLVAAAGANSEA